MDICDRHPQMRHIDMSRVAVAFSQTRKGVRHGIHASLTPMRFEDGAMEGKRRGRMYRAQRLFDAAGIEMLYILKFYLPRFQNESFEEKLTTIFHELWHISADFNGDIRRHAGRCYVHTSSEKEYDRQMLQFARQWLQMGPPDEVFDFVKLKFSELQRRYGKIVGVKVPQPKLIPIARSA
jgi:predicted metallopeptidase|tara:strand:- start:36 stop:575 length:540 start_codon:yes stop_codon:yes gene_type:complete